LRTRVLALGERTLVMGILNLTPDSFSDGGQFDSVEAATGRGLALLDEGADLLDLGGESTRPGAVELSAEEEQARVLPVLEAILRERPGAVLSVDTYHASTAERAVAAGAEIVNDVSGLLWDEAMGAACARVRCGVILMHTRGRPSDWAALPGLAADEVVPLVRRELEERVAMALGAGIAKDSIVLDPGFGFGKRGQENYPLLAGFGELQGLGYPMLAGISRKGFLGQSLARLHEGRVPTASARLAATIAANTAAILAGAHLVRVHDVLAGLEAAAVADETLEALKSTTEHRLFLG
jgi:dihydropteroate synthase